MLNILRKEPQYKDILLRQDKLKAESISFQCPMRPTLLNWWISTDALLLIDISLKGRGWRRAVVLRWMGENVPSAEMWLPLDIHHAWPNRLRVCFCYLCIYTLTYDKQIEANASSWWTLKVTKIHRGAITEHKRQGAVGFKSNKLEPLFIEMDAKLCDWSLHFSHILIDL